MQFTSEQIDKMKAIFNRLEPRTLESIQFFEPLNPFRTGCTFGIKNKYSGYICIFQNFETLSIARTKMLEKMKKKISFEINITYPCDGIVRIGWKCV